MKSSLIIAAAVAFGISADVQAQSQKTPWRNLTLEKLTAVHWQWIMSSQVATSAVFDDSGVDAFSNQPYFTAPGGSGQLLFLGGTFSVNQLETGDVLGQVTRTVSFKQGTSLFFPLLDGEWDNVLQSPHLGGKVLGGPLGVTALKALVAASPDIATGLFCTLNGHNVPYARLQSAPFSYRLPGTDNLLQNSGLDVSGTVAPAVSDGFFTFLPGSALPAGTYELRFGGGFPFDADGHMFVEDITYKITVTP
jgi:hypothetical protein